MTRLGILGVPTLALVMLASDALAQRRGGAVSGGVRGAVVGGMVGGSEGAATGAKVGVVTGATRAAVNREAQARTEYEATTEYQNAQHSNFNEAPPEVLGTTDASAAKKATGEAVIRKDGKPIVGITFPSDWNQNRPATTTSRPLVGMDKPTRCSSPRKGSLTNKPGSRRSRKVSETT